MERFERAKAEGDLPAHIDTEGLMRVLIAMLQGISVQANQGATRITAIDRLAHAVKRAGKDVTVVANSLMLHRALNVAEGLAADASPSAAFPAGIFLVELDGGRMRTVSLTVLGTAPGAGPGRVLGSTRPTAVNLAWAIGRMAIAAGNAAQLEPEARFQAVLAAAEPGVDLEQAGLGAHAVDRRLPLDLGERLQRSAEVVGRADAPVAARQVRHQRQQRRSDHRTHRLIR